MDLDICPVMLVEEVCGDGRGYVLVGGHGGGEKGVYVCWTLMDETFFGGCIWTVCMRVELWS